MHRVKVFDFDRTIYGGDSSIDFFLFVLKKHKKLIWKIPLILWYGFLYSLRIIKIEKWKEYFFSFLAEIHVNKKLVEEFWRKNARKLNDELMQKLAGGMSCVISASPEFLVKPCFRGMGNVKVIATEMDIKTGKIKGKNCRGEEKINRYKKVFRNERIVEFYSDSEKDRPLTEIAEKAYIVDKGKVLPWDEEYLWRKKAKKISWSLFAVFFIVYLIGGILLSYNYNFKTNIDLLFSSDSARVIDGGCTLSTNCASTFYFAISADYFND